MSIADLQTLPRKDLIRHYVALAGTDPPRSLSREVIAHIIAYERQAAGTGGLSLRLRRQLRAIASEDRAVTPNTRLKSDARLVREWNGVSHVVDRMEDGFVYRGRTYNSLSAIAREITGARWSGPRFFGLKASA
ncbi:hypothetical protein HPO_09448 [Hyphomonas polymorpha PS728]|uniref:DUF2924 domain-containing protein n=1 Tax=Hyphomonas polymorpha PS728 TaxID=1280954 RepID=A0A062VJM0_9PROT|nr:hypothetical protein HPO_09448 [Hyphomonas polymorpha PS728]